MVDLATLKPCRILVAGDLMLDRYTMGRVKRISPEAPVPVLNVVEEKSRPGGAGNVALSLQALGAEVTLLSQVGDDQAGTELMKALRAEGLSTHAIMVNKQSVTSQKQRLIADTQQLIRIDREEIVGLPRAAEELLVQRFPALLAGADVVAVSDYGKGFLSDAVLDALIAEASRRSIPVVVDPKGTDYAKYRGSTLIKPNLKEALEAARMPDGTSLEEVAQELLTSTLAKEILITLSQDGIALFSEEKERRDFPVRIREILDVTGAGDTVLTMLCMAFANGWSTEEAAELANIGAGIAIEHLGCHRVTWEQLKARVGDLLVERV